MERNYLVAKALGLVRQCPGGKRNATCPFRLNASCLSLRESYNILKAYNVEELTKIVEMHEKCFCRRIQVDVMETSVQGLYN